MPQLTSKQGTPEWLEARKGKITASVAAACLGLDPYISRQKAYRMILGTEPQEWNYYQQHGLTHEKLARESYEAETGRLVISTGFWTHPAHPWLGASPDGFSGDGLVQFKCPQKLPQRMHPHHRIQCLVEMIVMNRPWCDYYCWTEDGTYYDRLELISINGCVSLVRKLEEFFMAYVKIGVEPPRKKPRRRKKL